MKKAVAALAAVAAVGLLAGCTGMSTNPDEIGLTYNAGPVSDTQFDKCVNPGNREWDGPSDQHFAYPHGQRTWVFAGRDTTESEPISVVTKDNVTMTVSGVVTFALNTDCKTLKQFHERIGIKYRAWMEDGQTGEGWLSMLNTYLKQPLDKAMDAVSKEYGYKQLYSDPKVKEEWEAKVAVLASRFIKDQATADFFCQPSYAGAGTCGQPVLTLQAPVPPENIRVALTAEQEAVAQNEAQKQKNTRVRTELESIKELVAVLGPEGYVLYQAIQSGKVSVVPVPNGSNININPQSNQ